jgi:hypothetical protein
MRRIIELASLLITIAVGGCAADSGPPPDDGGGNGSADDLPAPAQGFQVITPTIELMPGAEVTYCYYTRLPTTGMVGVKQWESKMTPGSHHMILYFTSTELKPAGTLTTDGCGGGLGVWTYSAQEPSVQFAMPKGIGMAVPAEQPAFIQMHYLNATDKVLPVHVTLNATTYAANEVYTPASAFITYNSNIKIPKGVPNNPGIASAGGVCPVSADAKFFTMSTHAHKQAVGTQVLDGNELLFASTDWEHPGAKVYPEDPFYSFTSGALTYRCDYKNPTGRVVEDGNSAVTDEMCMAIGYFFPATRPIFCLNSAVIAL